LLDLLFAARRAEPLPDVDPEVVRRAQGGDARAFTDLVRHYEPRLRALAFRLVEDRDLTDDVLQEAYVRAFKALGRFRGDSSLGTWLYRITYNACIDEMRRGRKIVPLFSDIESDSVDPRAGPEESAVARGDLAAALASLPSDLRAVVVLVDADGLDYREAAKVLGVPPGTVGSRLNRARTVLRAALGVAG